MKHHDLTGWKGYGRPDCKLTLRINPDPGTVAETMIHDFHAEVAENRLLHEGVKPELNFYLRAIGEVLG
jgi:hypothetical protein